ncbi:MAG: trypsin-like serine protease [Chitinophagaceae bacterium]|nr:trypsin-like serine protease [Chitinophagaceae bacterium]
MTLNEIIDTYKTAVIQIATQQSTGSGFYLPLYDLIVTNHHVVRDNAEVTIKGKNFEKQFSRVLFTDSKYDLAFLMPPHGVTFPNIQLGDYHVLRDGDEVLAMGHPYGLNYTSTQGVISRVDRIQNGLKYIQIDAAINPGNSGGPLVDEAGRIIGMNTFIIRGGDNLGFALPAQAILEALNQYTPLFGTPVIRCSSCSNLVSEQTIQGKYCPECGSPIRLLPTPEKAPVLDGVSKRIDDILHALGKDKDLARTGYNQWEVKQGQAIVNIVYDAENNLVLAEAILCNLPTQQFDAVYRFMLEENAKMRHMSFSLSGQAIFLSTLAYDADLSFETGRTMLLEIFTLAEKYQKQLINTWHCPLPLDETD